MYIYTNFLYSKSKIIVLHIQYYGINSRLW